MAARAHAVHDYSFAGASERPRRQVWLREDDEVVLPRGRGSQVTGALVLSAVLASALVAGAAYAVYWAAPPELAATPAAAPLTKEWRPDDAVTRANVLKALRGPAAATPAAAAPLATEEPADAPPVTQAAPQERDEVIIDDSAPGLQESLPQPAAPQTADQQPTLTQPMLPDPILPKKETPDAPEAPYPNPTTTPPEMTNPPADSWPDLPKLDPQNPY
jgi:hypothetical protein